MSVRPPRLVIVVELEAAEREQRVEFDPFGATMVWLWKKSKKATPVSCAFAQTLTVARAVFIWFLR